jgi:hypothetical protein
MRRGDRISRVKRRQRVCSVHACSVPGLMRLFLCWAWFCRGGTGQGQEGGRRRGCGGGDAHRVGRRRPVVGDRRRCSPGARETGETDGGGGPILVARRAAGLRRLAVGAQEEGDSGQGRCTARRRAAVPTAGDATRQRDGLLAAQGREGGGCATGTQGLGHREKGMSQGLRIL